MHYLFGVCKSEYVAEDGMRALCLCVYHIIMCVDCISNKYGLAFPINVDLCML